MSKKEYNVHSLRKINIENLFSTDVTKPHTNGKLDINTLFSSNKSVNDFVVDPTVLLTGGIKRKRMLEECYINIYKTCWDMLVQADKSGTTDIVFEVPEQPNCIGYSTLECITIIEKNLMAISNNGIKCKPVNERRLFITWYDIEKSLLVSDKNINEHNNNNSDQY
jgi:hypothetical protein